jgi:hypothetical protein
MEVQEIIRDYFENLYSNKFSKLNKEDINCLNRSITQDEIEAATKSIPKKKSPGPDGLSAEF